MRRRSFRTRLQPTNYRKAHRPTGLEFFVESLNLRKQVIAGQEFGSLHCDSGETGDEMQFFFVCSFQIDKREHLTINNRKMQFCIDRRSCNTFPMTMKPLQPFHYYFRKNERNTEGFNVLFFDVIKPYPAVSSHY